MPFDRAAVVSSGFCITDPLLDEAEIAVHSRAIEAHLEQEKTEGTRGGMRDVLRHIPVLCSLPQDPRVRIIAETILGPECFLVRATYFDKTPGANWKVPWHQDLTIAVSKRLDVPGYGPWSSKEGVTHVQPPTAVLEQMVTIRIHLDACPATNGALRVLPGTHRLGRLNQNRVQDYVGERRAVVCEAKSGEALVMRPLLLHASSASENPGHRRVLHFDFARGHLAAGLEWTLRG